MARVRTRMSGLIVHVTPKGKCSSSPRNKAEQQLERLKRLLRENEVVAAKKKEPAPFKLFGDIELTFEIPMEILIKAKFVK